MKLPPIKPLNNVFTDHEAWGLFRWAAWLEAIGWTMLLAGILFRAMNWPGESWMLPIGGSVHGMFVVYYMGVVFAAHRSFHRKWSTLKMIFAEVINAVPYAVLVFEQIESRARKTHHASAKPQLTAVE